MRKPIDPKERKQISFSVVVYLIIFVCLSLPWMVIGDEKYSLLKLAMTLKPDNAEAFFATHGIVTEHPVTMYTGIKISLIFYLVYFILSLLYTLTVIFRKNWNINLAALLSAIMLAYTGNNDAMIGSICTNVSMSTLFPFGLLLLSTIETIGRKMIELWEDTVQDASDHEKAEREARLERERRLYFPGKYSKLFSLVVWKNFRNNLKDYAILLLCNGLVFAFIFTGFGFHKLLNQGDKSAQAGYFVGAGKILFGSIVELGVVGVFMLVLLMLYYLRKRIPQYGIFRTLGIRKKTLYLCIAAELGIGAVISMILGGISGCLLIRFLQLRTLTDQSTLITTANWLSPLILLKSLAIMLLIYIVTFFVTHDLFVGFRMGSLTDLQMMKEWRPQDFLLLPLIAGAFICTFSLWLNNKSTNYESLYYLLVCLGGMYLILRFGLSLFINHWEKKPNHLLSLLPMHPFFHRSRTSSWYIFGLSVMHICILSLFSLQLFSTRLVDDPDALYPYDMVCLANDDNAADQTFIEALEKECGAVVSSYPMVRVSGTDATETLEGPGQTSIRGQQIGISESTYHDIKKALDPSYKKKDLGLADSDEFIYIVYQRDPSTKAKPIDYRSSRSRPYLYPGLECEYVDPYSHHTSFKRYRTVGEAVESLFGIFCEGDKENIVVFSDSYFEQAKELWKTTNQFTGDILTDPSEIASPELTRQGPTSLLLVNVDESRLDAISSLIDDFKARHRDDEQYDSQIESIYLKSSYVQSLATQLQIKTIMAKLLIIAFFTASVLLLVIKMLTERTLIARRTDFLRCLGMKKKDRIHLMRHEMNIYVGTTAIFSLLISCLLLATTMHARLYSFAEALTLWKLYLPFAFCDLLAFAVVVWILTTIGLRQYETKV